MGLFSYLISSITGNFSLTKYTPDDVHYYSPIGFEQNSSTMIDIYTGTELQYINYSTGPLQFQTDFYGLIGSSSLGQVNALSATDDVSSRMNIFGISSSLLTTLLPWNKSKYMRVNSTGGVISPSWFPSSTSALLHGGDLLTIAKLIALFFVGRYAYKKYY